MVIKVGDKEASNYQVINLDTNEVIRGVQEANDETGEYKVIIFSKYPEVVLVTDPTTGLRYAKIEVRKGKIKIVRKEVRNE